MGTRSRIAVARPNGYESIYCHWDGYLEGVGKTLLEHYTSTDKIDQLMKLGDLSNLGDEIGTQHAFSDRVENQCTAYGRDRGEEEVESKHSATLEKLYEHAEEYNYLYQDGQWLLLDEKSGKIYFDSFEKYL